MLIAVIITIVNISNLIVAAKNIQGNDITLTSLEANSTTPGSYSDLETMDSLFKPSVQSLNQHISKICEKHMEFVKDALNESTSWAIHMLDAGGRQPSGMLNGGYKWLGDFDECLKIKADNLSQDVFNGRYCLIQVMFPRQKNTLFPQYPVAGLIAVCVPDTCTTQDTLNLAYITLPQKVEESIKVVNAICQEKNKKLDTKAKTVLCILIALAALVLTSTIYDVIQRVCLTKPIQNVTLNELEATVNGLRWPNTGSRGDINLDNGPEANHVNKMDINESHHGTLTKVLLAFSAYTNGLKLLNTHQGADTLCAINGLRLLSVTWIILGHTYSYSYQNTDNYFNAYRKFYRRISFMAIANADLGVDTFFAISGLLVAYVTLKTMKKQNGRLNVFLYYFHRFWRLTPVYMLVLTVYVSLFNYIGTGPLWGGDAADRKPCERFWWYNLLYINNFQALPDQCLGWTWYLANDMQFFVLSPILILSLFRSKVAGSVVAIVGILGTTILTGIISYNLNLGISSDTSPSGLEFNDKYYIRPYCRIGPYIIGIYTGYLLYEKQCKCRINKFLNLLLWTVSAVVTCTVIYGIHPESNGNFMSKELAAMYNAVHTSLWGLCICWIVFSCSTRQGGIVSSLLSWKGFVPLSRLSYSVYLIHPIIMYYYAGSRRRIIHWTDLDIIYMYLGHICLSFTIAIPVTLLFEMPMIQLEKVILRR